MINFSLNQAGVFDPRDYQEDGLNKIMHHLSNTFIKGICEPAFVEYSVGYGKTGIYAFIARKVTEGNRLRAFKGKSTFKVLVIARQTELIDQNSKFAWSSGVPNTVVASDLNKGKNAKNIKLQNVVFATEQTLWNRIESGMFDNWTPDLVLIDECHQLDWKDIVKWAKGDQGESCKSKTYTKVILHLLNKNPKTQIIGGTGSPWRMNEWIKGNFWKSCIDRKNTEDLINAGWLVPIQWGVPDVEYDYSSVKHDYSQNAELSESELDDIATKDLSLTHSIMREIVENSKNRRGVLIFCAGRHHIVEAKESLIESGVPESQIGVITDSTGYKVRTDILDRAREGNCKYVLNIGVLTAGVNVPLWDHIALLRPMGSVVMFTQSVGRVLRLCDGKEDALVSDYAGCVERLGLITDQKMFADGVYKKASAKKRIRICGLCETENAKQAIKCRNETCDRWFIDPSICENTVNDNQQCSHKNAPSARMCGGCGGLLRDPNEALNGKHYTEDMLKPIVGMQMFAPNKKEVVMEYHFEDGFIAREQFYPYRTGQVPKWQLQKWTDFLKEHAIDELALADIKACKNTFELVQVSHLFRTPNSATYRDKKGKQAGRFHIVSLKRFGNDLIKNGVAA
ncbi:DEAD/DEAH box helicase family protein [Pseudoalteromonas sp. NBT06-2]|uniref:DEAD/DEAH box helicase n=1 Tax=Pseudoalteromonas sp. NBT06-2 TaxID=2025950 RepID=UPI0014829099|nr:DEAD/DEAH box helicase family protein [Pseudoalteromonas sp. NBT06-2]